MGCHISCQTGWECCFNTTYGSLEIGTFPCLYSLGFSQRAGIAHLVTGLLRKAWRFATWGLLSSRITSWAQILLCGGNMSICLSVNSKSLPLWGLLSHLILIMEQAVYVSLFHPLSNGRAMIAEVQILGQFFIYIVRGKLSLKHIFIVSTLPGNISKYVFERLIVLSGFSELFSPSQTPQEVLTCQWIKVIHCETHWASYYAMTGFQVQAGSLWDTEMVAATITRQASPLRKLWEFTRPQFPHQHNNEHVISF